MPTFDKLNEMDKSDKGWSSATSLFKWRFRSLCRRCCLIKLPRMSARQFGWDFLFVRRLLASKTSSELSSSLPSPLSQELAGSQACEYLQRGIASWKRPDDAIKSYVKLFIKVSVLFSFILARPSARQNVLVSSTLWKFHFLGQRQTHFSVVWSSSPSSSTYSSKSRLQQCIGQVGGHGTELGEQLLGQASDQRYEKI